MSRWTVITAALLMAACGGTAASPRTCTPLPAPGTHAQAGAVSVDADRRRVGAGNTVTFMVTATGPAQYQADCSGPIQLLVNDAFDIRVHAARSAPTVPTSCGNIQLAAGHRVVYSIAWQLDTTLPAGEYVATVLLGDQPAVSVPVTVLARQERPVCGPAQ